jgi:hypothetical protein
VAVGIGSYQAWFAAIARVGCWRLSRNYIEIGPTSRDDRDIVRPVIDCGERITIGGKPGMAESRQCGGILRVHKG